MVGKAENVEQEGIYRQNGNMNLILGLKLVKPKSEKRYSKTDPTTGWTWKRAVWIS